MKIKQSLFFTMFVLFLGITQEHPAQSQINQTGFITRLQIAVDSGVIAYKLTEPQEVKRISGAPQQENRRRDGGMDVLELVYPGAQFTFGKYRKDANAIFTLLHLTLDNKPVDIGQNRKLVLRDSRDLKKLDRFQGFQNVSLKKVDLKNEAEFMASMPFDSRTEWPEADSLPAGFNPRCLLENGKNPGLGVRSLHEQGITGRGVGIAIIDQPLLLNHEEYVSRLVRYDATEMAGFPPQMHGSPIASIVVGKNIGVAPEATLSWFAVPMWQKDNTGYIRALHLIFDLNKHLPKDETIRVVSISDGRFAGKKRYEEWQNVLNEARERGLFVVTCDTSDWRFGTLTLSEGGSPDNPQSYRIGKYSFPDDVLRVPTGNKTLAGYSGTNVYVYEREGGRSWAAPYLAGLAALAFQVNPQITPQEIKEMLIKTATSTKAGAVVNPIDFINRIKKMSKDDREVRNWRNKTFNFMKQNDF